MKAGDIIAIKNNTATSRFIQFSTVSSWSHVGIATSANKVLEASKEKTSNSAKCEVRESQLTEFLDGSTKIMHLIRPHELTPEETRVLRGFTKSASEKGYSALHASMTVVPQYVRLAFGGLCLFSLVDSPTINSNPLFSALLAVFLFMVCELLICSYRSKWGVKKMEEWYCKTKIGKYLVEVKSDYFCSRLVLAAEKFMSSNLPDHLPNEDEVQPRHIVKACKKLGWQSANHIH